VGGLELTVLAHYHGHLRGADAAAGVVALDMVPHFDAVHQGAVAVAPLAMAALPAGKYDFHRHSITKGRCG